VAALLAIPAAGAIQVLVREAWQSTAAPAVIVAGTGGGEGSGEGDTAAGGHIITGAGPAPADE
jgi:hypothetical protein